MKILTTIKTSVYIAKFIKVLMAIQPTNNPDKVAENNAFIHIELANIIQKIWSDAYESGLSDGKKIGMFEDKKN